MSKYPDRQKGRDALAEINDMEEFYGGIAHVVNFPAGLSPEGRQYFINGLQTWRARTVSALAIKMQGLKEFDTDIDDYIRCEAEIFYDEDMEHDLQLGPVSVLQSVYDLKYMNSAFEYIAQCDQAVDTDLYHAMDGERLIPDLNFLMPEHKKDDDVTQLFRIMHKSRADAATVHYDLKQASYRNVMRHFRCAQFDLLNPLEKKFFIHSFNARKEILPLAHDALFIRDYHILPGKTMTLAGKVAAVKQGYDTDIYDLIPDQVHHVLALHQAFANMPKDYRNSYHFMVGQELRHHFSIMQSYCHEATLGDMTFEQFMDSRTNGLYQLSVHPKEYTTYFKSQHEKSRVALASPDGLQGLKEINLDYDDFTTTFYDSEMDKATQNSFDRFLQSKADQTAAKYGCQTVHIPSLRKMLEKYDYPDF